MLKKTARIAAALVAAAVLSPSALAGGDGYICDWKEKAKRTVAESAPTHPVLPDENAVVLLETSPEFVGPPRPAGE